ncbi:MAG: hypothetical protein WA825_18320 [Steroidobacteraceae bacterium]
MNQSAMHADLAGVSVSHLPLVIGVTGHRDLRRADFPVYRRLVSEMIGALRQQYPGTPLRVISALAEGADRLVAEVALESGCELIAALPLEAGEYERDFPDSIGEFRTLLARIPSQRAFAIPLAEGSTGHSVRETSAHRVRQYAQVGDFIALHSHLLLALWDGAASAADAGTADVVRMKLEGSHTFRDTGDGALDTQDSGPVYHIRAHRDGDSAPATGEAVWLYPEEAGEETFRTVCGRIERFNSDAARQRIARPAAQVADELLVGVDDSQPEERMLAAAFGEADRLAAYYQRITHRVLQFTLLLAATLTLTFEVYAEVLSIRALPILYLAIFASITLIYLWQRRIDAQGRYLDYRAVAEGLRVQFYWRLAGLPDSASANYLRKQLDELRWIREALRGCATTPPRAQPRMERVFVDWVKGQTQYFRARTERQEHRMRRIEWASGVLLAIGLLATLALVVLWPTLERHTSLHHWMVLVMGFTPIAAALSEAFAEKSAVRAQANQYARFATIFQHADTVMTRLQARAHGPERSAAERALVRQLGREALMESGDWVLLLRERPLVLPKG